MHYMVFKIVLFGNVNWTEVDNAAELANQIQDFFRFEMHPDSIVLPDDKYRLPNGAIDIDQALVDLLAPAKRPEGLVDKNHIFVTAMPYSDAELAKEFAGKSVNQDLNQCYFYDVDVLGDKKTAVVSTFIWDHLQPRPEYRLPIGPSGRRETQPFLLYAFARIAIERLIVLPHHIETRGCPCDYCNSITDIDAFFDRGGFCDEDEQYIKSKINAGAVTGEQIDAIKALFRRAAGKPAQYEYHVAISYASPQRPIAEEIATVLREHGLRVFFDDFYPDTLLGKDLMVFFEDVYRRKAKYCAMIISKDYASRMWSSHERSSALRRALEERGREYILPVRVDSTELPGMPIVFGELRLEKYNAREIAEIIFKKVQE